MEAKFVDVHGYKTRYLEAGSGEPLLLIHGGHFGLLCSGNDWEPVITRFAKDFHVFAIDKPGQAFTDNPKSDSDYVIGITVWHAYEFMVRLGIKKAHVAGHSRGGYTATRLALEHPDFVRTITLVDSGTLITQQVLGGTHGRSQWYEELDRKAQQIKDPKERCRLWVSANSFGDRHITEDYVELLYRISLLPKNQEAVEKIGHLNSQFILDLKDRVKESHAWIGSGRLNAPTLVVWAFNDPSAKLEPGAIDTMNLIFPKVPKAQMHILNQSGHFCFREQPDAFVNAVRAFISSS